MGRYLGSSIVSHIKHEYDVLCVSLVNAPFLAFFEGIQLYQHRSIKVIAEGTVYLYKAIQVSALARIISASILPI